MPDISVSKREEGKQLSNWSSLFFAIHASDSDFLFLRYVFKGGQYNYAAKKSFASFKITDLIHVQKTENL